MTPPPAEPTKYPDTGFKPNIFRPNPLEPNPLVPRDPLKPNPLEPRKFQPNPKTGEPELKAPPLFKPPTTPQPTPNPGEDIFDKIKNLIVPLGIGLVSLTGLMQPEKLREAANAGSCQSFAPGGCNADIRKNTGDAAKNSADNGTALAKMPKF